MFGAAEGDQDTPSTCLPFVASTVRSTEAEGLRYTRGGAFVLFHGGYRGGCDHQEYSYTPTTMRKTHGFNWRVFLRVRQKQLMLVGGLFLALIARSSLVSSVRDGEAARGEGHQYLLHRDQMELRHEGAQVEPAASSKLHAKPALASQHNVVPEVDTTHGEHDEDRHLHAEEEGEGEHSDHDKGSEDEWDADEHLADAEDHFDEMDGMDWGDHWEEMEAEEGDSWAEGVQQKADRHAAQQREEGEKGHQQGHEQDHAEAPHTPQPTDEEKRTFHKGAYTEQVMRVEAAKLDMDMPRVKETNAARLKAVHGAILHAWQGYKDYAWGEDELSPISKHGQKWFGLGLTLIDSLDLLWLIGEHAEFRNATQWVATQLDCDTPADVNVFETTIRLVGGLLSAYHYSQEDVFLQKAKHLGANMRSAFSSASGVPWSDCNLATKASYAPAGAADSSLSEATSIQLEYKYLAYLSGDEDLYNLADLSMEAIDRATNRLPAGMRGIPPMFINAQSGQFNTGATITLGARGDSYYEYLLKQWLITGKLEDHYLERYLESVEAIRDRLLAYSAPHGLAFLGELMGGNRFSPKMDHLVCFFPGTLALGHMHGAPDWHLELAQELVHTCYQMYNTTATGLSPEIAHFNMNGDADHDIEIHSRDTHNILRPETVESLFYLYRATGNRVYQEWGWQIFSAFEKHSRLDDGGYSGLANVQDLNSQRIDKMESFWLGETLKYLYLLFADASVLPLDKYVLNTEAHPLPIFHPPWYTRAVDAHHGHLSKDEDGAPRKEAMEEMKVPAHVIAESRRAVAPQV